MNLRRWIWLLIGAATLSGCAQFRGPGPLDSGLGEFKGPSEYAQAPHTHHHTREGFKSQNFVIDWPVQKARLSQRYRPARNSDHAGIDLSAPRGTPILAAHDGFVVYAGRGYRGYGKMIIVEFNDEWATLYAHLDRISVREGDAVVRGQTLGKMGRTGRATGVHLHFELMRNKVPIDPLELLQEDRLAARD